jgi:hypothetical protein
MNVKAVLTSKSGRELLEAARAVLGEPMGYRQTGGSVEEYLFVVGERYVLVTEWIEYHAGNAWRRFNHAYNGAPASEIRRCTLWSQIAHAQAVAWLVRANRSHSARN